MMTEAALYDAVLPLVREFRRLPWPRTQEQINDFNASLARLTDIGRVDQFLRVYERAIAETSALARTREAVA